MPEVEVGTCAIDLDTVRRHRAAMNSRAHQSSAQKQLPRVHADIYICRQPVDKCQLAHSLTKGIPQIHSPMEEIEHAIRQIESRVDALDDKLWSICDEEIEQAKQDMSEKQFNQEFNATFESFAP